jgi:hypothetical protein
MMAVAPIPEEIRQHHRPGGETSQDLNVSLCREEGDGDGWRAACGHGARAGCARDHLGKVAIGPAQF